MAFLTLPGVHDMKSRMWWVLGSKIPDFPESCGRSCDQLCQQYRSQKPVHHLCEGIQGTTKHTGAGVGGVVRATVKKGRPELRRKVHPAVVIQQRKSYRRKDVVFLYF